MDPIGYSGAYLLLVTLTAPIWVLVVMFSYHRSTAKPFWQFSLRFLLVFIAAESVAFVVCVAVWQFLNEVLHMRIG